MSSEQTVVPLSPPFTDPAPLSNVVGGETNLLHRTAWSDPSNPLKVCFDPWGNSQPSVQDPESIQILLNDVEIGRKEWTAPIHPDDLYVAISEDKLPSGVNELRYIVTIWSGTPHESHPLTITIDKSPPALATSSKLIFPPDVLPPNAITAAYLADPAHQDQVLATVPDYSVKKAGDEITWYWELSPGGREIAGTKTLELSDVGQPVQVGFPGDVLRQGNGDFFATYRVSDRAGNVSVLSVDEKLIVNIRPPTPRKFPTVKEASSTPAGTGVLNPFRGVNGITVVVPKDEVDPGEEVTVDFIGLGGESGVGSVVGVRPTVTGGLEFAIAAAIVAANIPVQGDGRKVEVRYRAGTSVSATFTLSIDEISSTSFGSVECDKAQIGSPATLSKATVAQSGANIQIEEWAYHTDSQLINVWAVAASVRTDFLTAGPTPISGGGKFSTPLPKDYVAALALNSMFTLYASVSFDQGHSYRPFRTMQIKLIV